MADLKIRNHPFLQTIEQTNPTLLRVVSNLVSNGEILKPALSISQYIQYNIDEKPNQTTLGTRIKLHHRHRSRELIDPGGVRTCVTDPPLVVGPFFKEEYKLVLIPTCSVGP